MYNFCIHGFTFWAFLEYMGQYICVHLWNRCRMNPYAFCKILLADTSSFGFLQKKCYVCDYWLFVVGETKVLDWKINGKSAWGMKFISAKVGQGIVMNFE